MMKFFRTVVLATIFGSFIYPAMADEQRTNRVIENPVQDGNLVMRVNDGGVKKDVITVTGSTSLLSLGASGETGTHTINGSVSAANIKVGTWTPGTTQPNVTLGSAFATYARVGNIVFIEGSLTAQETGAFSSFEITGLPYTSTRTVFCPAFHNNGTGIVLSSGYVPLIRTNAGATTLSPKQQNPGTGVETFINDGLITGTWSFQFRCQYLTTDAP